MWSDSWNDPPGEQERPWIMPAGNSNKIKKCPPKNARTFWQAAKETKVKSQQFIYPQHKLPSIVSMDGETEQTMLAIVKTLLAFSSHVSIYFSPLKHSHNIGEHAEIFSVMMLLSFCVWMKAKGSDTRWNEDSKERQTMNISNTVTHWYPSTHSLTHNNATKATPTSSINWQRDVVWQTIEPSIALMRPAASRDWVEQLY